ncbi:DUF1616 domain-containing protein [Natrialbaceae archaeon AArc-T1-2]|uniref:DUF1616 domain-containing protein n=1 Tax=Natrialbaceae archaeon AArc-T1-2 TaxID=3053904 RepID=UPI00255AD835|nr:DUF1616 domain-containing protein [Natrialbaceae archaeon AArc-T1-2]WIV67491.1 DUF1616 domain-containing protein [Natrialbaceae archaeon AArc-T1-2]
MTDRSTRLIQPFTAVRQGSKRLVTEMPTDLAGVAGFVFVAVTVLAVVDVGSTLVRAAVGFPLLCFLPGYATVSALFPRASDTRLATETAVPAGTSGISDLERLALAFGLSVAILPLLALVIAAGSWGYSTGVVVTVLAGYVLGLVAIATVRRRRVPRAERYRIHLGRRVETARTAIFDTNSAVHTAINVALVVSMVLALTTVGYALVSPQSGEQYTSLELLTENDSGEYVTGEYPSTVDAGESVPVTIAVENWEGDDTEYTAVVQEQRLTNGEVNERTEIDRLEYAVSDGETAYGESDVTPVADGGTVRITVLLYVDDVPETPTTDNAYRYTYFWIEVTDGGFENP